MSAKKSVEKQNSKIDVLPPPSKKKRNHNSQLDILPPPKKNTKSDLKECSVEIEDSEIIKKSDKNLKKENKDDVVGNNSLEEKEITEENDREINFSQKWKFFTEAPYNYQFLSILIVGYCILSVVFLVIGIFNINKLYPISLVAMLCFLSFVLFGVITVSYYCFFWYDLFILTNFF
jgi:hypothetical protein